ncbi:MAG TPA: hypothetical protein VEZ17_16740, partial [Chitinophagaceae bacterium]|nr:hypothetical protein [Chitinophagaceae bacterium]
CYPQLQQITEVFQKAAADLCENMNEEEQILFPYIRFQVHIKKGNIARSFLPSGSITHRINHMEMQHTSVKEAFKIIRELSNNYRQQSHGCATCAPLFQLLEEFDNDLKQHFNLETKLLFSKAIQLEKEYLEQPDEIKIVKAEARIENISVLL